MKINSSDAQDDPKSWIKNHCRVTAEIGDI